MWLQTTQLGNTPTQTGLALNSKPQHTWALTIVQRPNQLPRVLHFTTLLEEEPFSSVLSTNLWHLCLYLCSQVTGWACFLFQWQKPLKEKFHIPHLPPLCVCPLHSTFSLVTQHRYVLTLIYSQPVTSALFPISYSLLKKTRPVKSSHPLRHFSHSLPYRSQHVKEVFFKKKKKEVEAENHRYLLINLETHKTQLRINALQQTSHVYSPYPEILVIIQGPAPLESLPHTSHPKVSAGHFQSTLATLLTTCCSSSTTERHVMFTSRLEILSSLRYRLF